MNSVVIPQSLVESLLWNWKENVREELETALIAHIVITGTPRPARLKKSNRGHLYNSRSPLIEDCKWLVKSQYRKPPFEGRVICDYFFGMPIPKTWSDQKKEEAHQGLIEYDKCDNDNLIKTYNDVIKNIVIKDDKQIRNDLGCHVKYDYNPRVEIWIYDGTKK